jgi:hypothetical protein
MSENFETQLRAALQRRDPPPGFAERVLAQTQPRKSPNRVWAMLAIAAMLTGGIFVYRDYQERRAEEAREQALTALRITAEKLDLVREKLNQIETENP